MRDVDETDTVDVVGAGTTGAGIAEVAAVQGDDVVLRDIERELVDAGVGRIESGLERGPARRLPARLRDVPRGTG